VRQAVGSDIADDEAVRDVEFPRQGLVALARRIALQVDAVADDDDLAGRDAAADEVRLEGIGKRDDRCRAAVEKQLYPFEEPDDPADPDGIDGDDRAGPQIAVKNCGEVAMTMSGRGWSSPAITALTMKLMKSRLRSTTPLLAAMKVLTRMTVMPSIDSRRYQWFL
jgi:hypothetical protein